MTCNAINIKYKLSHALKEDEDDSQVDSLQGWAKTRQNREFARIILNSTHILDFLDERIFPFKDHKEQLSAFLGSWPLVNVVNHTGLEAEQRNGYHPWPSFAWAPGEETVGGDLRPWLSWGYLLERESQKSHRQNPETGIRAKALPWVSIILWRNRICAIQ
jgi:hypothetical protein